MDRGDIYMKLLCQTLGIFNLKRVRSNEGREYIVQGWGDEKKNDRGEQRRKG